MKKQQLFSPQERRELEREERALVLLDRPIVQHFMNALDTLGWKVVAKSGEPGGWPVPYWHKATNKWPSWCDDQRKKPSPKLQLIDGGKPPDDGDR